MPCYSEPHSYCSHSEGKCIEINSDKYIKGVIDNLTDMLCRTLTGIVEASDGYHDIILALDKDIQEWWERHKKFDNCRKDIER